MAKKQKTVFMCTECGNEFINWQGQCSFCGAWNTIKEQRISSEPANTSTGIGISSKNSAPEKLKNIGSIEYKRISSGIFELDRVLGGGIVPGSLVLISGEPGIGKSTLLAQTANNVASKYGDVLYVTGEESEEQVKLRADRVCKDSPNGASISDNLYIYSETNIENIISAAAEMKPKLIIIDSIQTMYSLELEQAAGSITQIRNITGIIMRFAKKTDTPIFIVAHINKSGDLAGPKTIEHMVDCVLSFNGERNQDLRILRSYKNRFGTTDEIGAWTMGEKGMSEVSDLSGSLVEKADCECGSVISATYEGSRPVFHEIQALVTKANVGFARRTAIGIDSNRLNMLLAVLEKHAGYHLQNYDVYVNIAGGLKGIGTATDLAIILAIVSSAREYVSPIRIACIGEVGLTGRLRSTSGIDKAISEAARLGYEAVIIPENASPKASASKSGAQKDIPIKIYKAADIADAISFYLGKSKK